MTSKKQPQKKQFVAALALLVGVALVAFAWKMQPDDFREDPALAIQQESSVQPAPSDKQNADLPVLQPVGRTIGKADAPVKVLEFASLTCSHCADFHNEMLSEVRKKLVDTGKLFIEFREFPLNKPALEASLILNCLPEDQYYGFMSLLFSTQKNWAFRADYQVPLRQNAKLAGMTDEAFDACLADKSKEQAMTEQIKQAADTYKIDATPTFIFNGGVEKLSGIRSFREFEDIVNRLSSSSESTPSQP